MTDEDRRLKVSVIIPAHNAEPYLRDAIESVLAQSYEVDECLVVDDGSSDRTAELAAGFGDPVRVLRQINRGVSTARNRGARQARGDLLAFLDADDRWLQARVERGVEAIKRQPEADAVICATRVVDRHLRALGVIRQDPALRPEDLLLCRGEMVSTSSNLLIRREVFEQLRGFDERLSTAADWALNYRLIERNKLVTLPEPLVEYRRHGSNMSANVDRFRGDMLVAFDGVFSRADAPKSLRRRAYANLHRMIAGSYFVEGRRGRFLRHAARSVGGHPSTLPYFLALPLRRLRRGIGAWSGKASGNSSSPEPD
jgi:glycosyltransferase involved in cell wall biosynthesis